MSMVQTSFFLTLQEFRLISVAVTSSPSIVKYSQCISNLLLRHKELSYGRNRLLGFSITHYD